MPGICSYCLGTGKVYNNDSEIKDFKMSFRCPACNGTSESDIEDTFEDTQVKNDEELLFDELDIELLEGIDQFYSSSELEELNNQEDEDNN